MSSMDISRFRNIPDELDIVNIGSGPSLYDFDWGAVREIRGYNLAVSPEDFRYDARIIKNYGFHLKENGIVIVVICPLSFAENEYLYKDSFSEKYVRLLPETDVDLPIWKYRLYQNVPCALPIKRAIMRCAQAIIRRLSNVGALSGKDTSMGEGDSGISALVNGWIKDNRHLTDLKDARQAEHYEEVFLRKKRDLMGVIDSCMSQQLVPVLLLPPLSKQLLGCMSREFVQRFVYDNLVEVQEKGVYLLDYMDDGRFQELSHYDSNGLFLKGKARRRFTRIVSGDILRLTDL